jgi:hypothetical protein
MTILILLYLILCEFIGAVNSVSGSLRPRVPLASRAEDGQELKTRRATGCAWLQWTSTPCIRVVVSERTMCCLAYAPGINNARRVVR